MKQKVIFSWSGGKDSAYCLNKVLNEGKYEVVYLLTTLNADFKRISSLLISSIEVAYSIRILLNIIL